MKKILILSFALLVCSLSAQVNNIYRSGGISQTVGAPTFKPGASGNIVAIDTVTGIWYISRDRYSVNWLSMGYRIENISGCSAPAYTPNKMNSTLVINNCAPPEMYAYNGATWEQVAGGGGGGGGLTTEQVQDIVAAMLVDGDGITTGYSDVDGLITVTNTAPDQTVTISSGSGISATGTYPNFTVASTITQYTDENAQDAIGAMIGNTLTYTDATPLLDVKTQMSITSDASGVKLSGDASTPGATMLYGTNGSGTKGWYAQPSGGGGGSDYLGTGFTSGGGSGTFPDGTHAALNDAFSTFYIDYSPGGQAAIAFEPDAAGGVSFYSPSGQSTIGLYDGIGVQVTGSYPFYIPLFTTSGKNALSPSEGAIVGDFTTKKLNYYNGTSWSQFEPLPTLGTSLQQIRVNSGGTALEYFTPSSLGITDLTGDVTATGPGSAAATISSFAVTSAKIANNAVNGTKIAMTGDVTGDIMVYDGTDYVRLAAGSTGNVLTSNGAATLPSWAAGGGGGGGASVITPTILSSDQDDYSPTGWATATHVRISGGSSIFAITSFAATSDGDTKHLINIGSYPMYFPSEHPDGTAANRILGYGCDFILYPGCAVDIMYDGTSSRWRIMGCEAPQQYSRVLFYNYTAGAAASGEQISTGAINSGSISGSNSAASNIPAAAVISSLTTTNGGGVYYFTRTAVQFGAMGSSHILFTSFISLPTLSDATNTYTFASQVTSGVNNSTINQNNAIGIRYSDGINSGKWEGYSRDNSGAESTVDLGITVSAATTYLLTTELDASRTEARFYVNGVMAGRVTGNMPNATGCGGRVILLKSAGTTARTVNIHRMSAMAIYP